MHLYSEVVGPKSEKVDKMLVLNVFVQGQRSEEYSSRCDSFCHRCCLYWARRAVHGQLPISDIVPAAAIAKSKTEEQKLH